MEISQYSLCAVSYQKIQHVFYVCVGRIVFEAWHKHTLEARRQREYFEVKENSLAKRMCTCLKLTNCLFVFIALLFNNMYILASLFLSCFFYYLLFYENQIVFISF